MAPETIRQTFEKDRAISIPAFIDCLSPRFINSQNIIPINRAAFNTKRFRDLVNAVFNTAFPNGHVSCVQVIFTDKYNRQLSEGGKIQ
jgi:hypothetical protein